MIISSTAISEAVNLCALNNQRFSAIGRRCFTYLETSGLLGHVYSADEADALFLSLVAAELEDDNDEGFERNQQTWALAA